MRLILLFSIIFSSNIIACQFTTEGFDEAVKEQKQFVENLMYSADTIAYVSISSVEKSSFNTDLVKYEAKVLEQEAFKGNVPKTIFWTEPKQEIITLNCEGLYWTNNIKLTQDEYYLVYLAKGEVLRARKFEFPSFSFDDELEVLSNNGM